MKTTQKGVIKEFFSAIIWILMTIFSILKSAFNFIVHLFFYNNISITTDVADDEIADTNTNDESKNEQTIDNNELKIEETKNNSLNDIKSNDEQPKGDENNEANDESESNEEDEREKIKEELEREDEEDSINDHNTNGVSVGKIKFNSDEKILDDEESSLFTPREKEKQKKKSEKIQLKEEDKSDGFELNNNEIKDEVESNQNPNKIDDSDTPIKERQLSSLSKLNRESSRVRSIKNNDKKQKQIISPDLLEKRRSAINKLIDSEEEYKRYLNILLDTYRAKVSGVIDKETNDILFGNIKPLISLSEQYSNLFREELKRGPDEAVISNCFVNVQQDCKQFLPFFINHKKTMSTYKKLITTNIRFMIIVKKIESNNANLKFSYLFSLPIHRLQNVITLLKEILKVTPQYHNDYQEIPKVLITLREITQDIDTKCKDNVNEIKLRRLQHQIIGCPTLNKIGCRYIRSFKLLDWKKLYILSDFLLITRGKRLRKKVEYENVQSIWLNNNTGTVHLRVSNKKDVRIRGGMKGNEIYTVLKNLINQKSSEKGNSTNPQSIAYRRSDLVRPLTPTSDLSAFDESSINTDNNTFATNSFFSSGANDTSNQISTFLMKKNNNNDLFNNEQQTDSSDDSYSDSDNNFSEIPDIQGNVEESESNETNEENTKSNNTTTDIASSNNNSNEEKFTEKMLDDRKVAIDNLIDSEKNFQQNLQSIISLYKNKFSKSIINEKTEQTVFGNVASLIILSEQTNNTLDAEIKRGADKAEIWKCYIITPQYIKIYHSYIINYTDMLSHYNDFVISDKKIKKFVKKIEHEDPQHRFTALSVLPFVRIPVLIKQLQTIINLTPDWHPDYLNLPDAISALSSISKDSSKMCTEAENLNKLIKIETSIIDCPSLFSENRNFLKAFVLNDKSSIFVLNDIIVFSRSNKKFKYYLSFSEIKTISNKLNSISLTMNDGKTHSIKSSDQTQKIYEFLKEQKEKQAVSI